MTLLDFAIKTATQAGDLILKESKKGFKINTKANKNDLVTDIDKKSENFIIKKIKSAYPTHAILAEESTKSLSNQTSKYLNKKYIWIIDPLDGTTNFAHGLPIFGISIALFKIDSIEQSKNYDYLSGEVILGVVNCPALNEIFYAVKGKGAYLNKKKIKTSKVKKLREALFVTGFPTSHREINLPYFSKILNKAQAMRRLGAASIDLCYVACGRFDGYWEFGLKPWDIAAGALIIKEAGGNITDTNGNLLDLFGADILATNNFIHKATVKSFEKL